MYNELSVVVPGWYDDGNSTRRWWDGAAWTPYVEPVLTTAPLASVREIAQPFDGARKRQLLAMVVANAVSSGWRVESQSDEAAVLVGGRRPNHVLHLLLTVFTVGLWGTVWILIALTAQETRKTVRIDAYGSVIWQD